uniref:Ribbon-helix-helix protein, CopG family n=1 Tax=Fervidicoccus fontis TaxID=683846 RepID=A0A7J3ZIJ4_9CREN
MRVITIKIDEELLERIDLSARKYGISRSELIRRAVIRYLSKLESEFVAEGTRSIVLKKRVGRE